MIKKSLFTLFLIGTLLYSLSPVVASQNGPYASYPKAFSGKGTIDRFDEKNNIIIINDSIFKLSQNAQINCPGNLNCSMKLLKKGDAVYYILKPKSLEIASLWWVKNLRIELDDSKESFYGAR